MISCPKQCKACIHRASGSGESMLCMYIVDSGHRRGFPIARVIAGEPCPRRETKGRKWGERAKEGGVGPCPVPRQKYHLVGRGYDITGTMDQLAEATGRSVGYLRHVRARSSPGAPFNGWVVNKVEGLQV